VEIRFRLAYESKRPGTVIVCGFFVCCGWRWWLLRWDNGGWLLNVLVC
jgi:hypothetical protein